MAEQSLPVNNNKAPEMDPVAKNEESDLLKNIVSTETGENEKSILGLAPNLDLSLLQGVAPRKSILLVILKSIFTLIVLVGVCAVVFFTSQLTGVFDFASSKLNIPNISEELASTNAEIISLQTDLNLYRFLETKAMLDKFTYDGDEFLNQYDIANSPTASDLEKTTANDRMTGLKVDLKTSFIQARDKYSKSFTAPLIDISFTQDDAQLETLYEGKLTDLITQKLATLATGTDSQTKSDYRNYQQTMKLIGNVKLKATLINTDFDSLDNDKLDQLIKTINGLIVNDTTVIQEIKNKRIKWSDVINEIKLRTIAVDPHFADNYYNDLGGIRYNSYDFDTTTHKISISGETKSVDTQNFTMIANLIDQLNQSSIFQNAAMSSFSKSGSLEQGYLGTLSLVFDLKDDKNSNKK